MKYNFNNLSKNLKRYLFVFVLVSAFLYGCFKLKSIDHPTTAQTNSHFDVTFVCEPDVNDKTEAKGYFGALIPKGWRVQDYTDFIVHYPDPAENIYGRLYYDQYYTAQLAANLETPDGYYWWGGRSIDDLELIHSNGHKCDNFSFTFRIYTDNKTGNFNLRYVIGTNGDNKNPVSNGKYVDVERTISITAGSQFPMKKTADWELLSPENNNDDDEKWDANMAFYSDKDYDGFFKRWYGWTGGDIGRSAPLGDGRSIWVWGDSHTGQVASNRSRLTSLAQFERNFIIEQSGEDFSAFRLINEGEPGSIKEVLIPTDDKGNNLGKHDEWYWPAGSSVYYRNGVPELQMVLSRVKNDGSGGMWGMEGVSADVAIFSMPDLKLKEIKKYKNKAVHLEKDGDRFGMDYAGYVFKDDDGVVYIYGIGDIPGICTRSGYVARVVNGDLTGEWEYYNAQTKEWSTNASWQNNLSNWNDAAIADNPVFVFKDAGKYFGIAQPGRCFSRQITLYEADSPYGPFHNPKVIGVLPSAISSQNSYFCSLLAIHPQYSKNGELFFSVSKNYQDDKPWYNQPGSADTYLPYFFRVKNWRDKLNISDMDITDNKGELTAQYESGLEALTDNSEATVYSASAATAWIQYISPSSSRLNRYTITSSSDSPDKDPMHWKVLGSNDGTNWTVLDERHYIEFDDRLQTINYNVPINNKMYTYFRLDVLQTKGGASLQIAEWQMFGEFEYAKGTSAGLDKVVVNGKSIPVEDVMTVTVSPSDNPKLSVALSTKDYGSIVDMSNSFDVTMDEAGIKKYTIKVVSEDGSSQKEYQLVFNRWFSFDDIVKVKWNNTLMLYLNRLENYNISAYQWYKNDAAISGATGKTYSAGNKKTDLLDPNSTYHITLKTPDGELRSDSKKVELKTMTVQVFPNPVKAGGVVTLSADIDAELLDGAQIEIYNTQGTKLHAINVLDKATSINMPASSGVYLLKFKTKQDFGETLRVVVQ